MPRGIVSDKFLPINHSDIDYFLSFDTIAAIGQPSNKASLCLYNEYPFRTGHMIGSDLRSITFLITVIIVYSFASETAG